MRPGAQQRMCFLRQLRKFNLPLQLLIELYAAICTSDSVYFGLDTKQGKNRLQQTVRSAEKIAGAGPVCHPGREHLQSQEAGRKHHYRTLS